MFENIAVIPSFKNAVSSAIASGKLSHALIFEGASSQIRLSAAKETAMAILCKGDNKPCNSCSSCHKVSIGAHPDLHITDKQGALIKVDDIRDIKEKAKVYPNDGDKSVYIICDAHNMNPQAQNALLKIFEEPAKHIAFILTCPSKSSLLDTIISRATSYTMGETTDEQSDEESEKSKELARDLLMCLIKGNELDFIRKTAVFQKDKALFTSVLRDMEPLLRDALVLSSGARVLISGEKETAEALKNSLTQKKLMLILNEIQSLSDNAENAANHNLSLTRLSSILYSIK
jgi:DNA polymerase-3 subunit delta'